MLGCERRANAFNSELRCKTSLGRVPASFANSENGGGALVPVHIRTHSLQLWRKLGTRCVDSLRSSDRLFTDLLKAGTLEQGLHHEIDLVGPAARPNNIRIAKRKNAPGLCALSCIIRAEVKKFCTRIPRT